MRKLLRTGLGNSFVYAKKKNIVMLRNFSEAGVTFLSPYKKNKQAILDKSPSQIKKMKKRRLLVPTGF
jgi:hypothetical protein